MQNLQEIQTTYKRKHNQRLVKFLIAFLLFLVLMFFLFAELFPRVAIRFVSEQKETYIGDQVYNSLVANKNINAMATMQLQSFADHLKLSKQYPIKVTVVQEDEVNAYALPGGHIIVNSAILQKINSSDAVVALLCHETIHINRRHSLQNILSSLSTGFFISQITRGGSGLTQFILGNANALRELSYTRKLEKEADESGMLLMERNGVSPSGMLDLMQTLQEEDEDNDLSSISFLSTHPLTEERISSAKKYIKSHQVDTLSRDQALNDIWKTIKNSVKK